MAPSWLTSAAAVVALAGMVSLPANAGRDEMDMEQGLAAQFEVGLGAMLQMANAKCKEATKMTTVESTLQAMRDCLDIVKKFPQELTQRKASGVLKDEQFRGTLGDLRSFLELADAKIAKVYSKHKSTLDSHHKKLHEDLRRALFTLKEAKDMNALGQESAGSIPASFMQVDDWKQKRRHSSLGDRKAGRGNHMRHLHRLVAHHMAGTGKQTRHWHISAAHHRAGTGKRAHHVHRSVAHHTVGTRKHTSHLHRSVSHHMAGTGKHASQSHSSFGGHKVGQRTRSRLWRQNLKLHKARSKVHQVRGTAQRRVAGQRLAKALKAKRKALRHATEVSRRKVAKSVAKSTEDKDSVASRAVRLLADETRATVVEQAAAMLAKSEEVAVVEKAAALLAKQDKEAVTDRAAKLLSEENKQAAVERATTLLMQEAKNNAIPVASSLAEERHKGMEDSDASASGKEHAGNHFAQDVERDEELEATAASLLNDN